jgi:hypothetical protein
MRISNKRQTYVENDYFILFIKEQLLDLENSGALQKLTDKVFPVVLSAAPIPKPKATWNNTLNLRLDLKAGISYPIA